MTKQQRLEEYMWYWDLATKLLGRPFTSDAYEDMSAYLLGRDTLEEAPELACRVEALDRQFVRALATSGAPWPHELTDMMSRMGLAAVPWWQRLLQAAAEERSGNLKEIAA